MAQIHNSDLSKELREGAKIQLSFDNIPNQLAEKVVPVMEVNPKLLKYANIVKSATVNNTTTTLYTTQDGRDFYLTAFMVGCDSTVTRYITITVDGASVNIGTTNNSGGNMMINLNTPIKIDKATNITGTSGGASNAYFTIIGYTIDNSRA